MDGLVPCRQTIVALPSDDDKTIGWFAQFAVVVVGSHLYCSENTSTHSDVYLAHSHTGLLWVTYVLFFVLQQQQLSHSGFQTALTPCRPSVPCMADNLGFEKTRVLFFFCFFSLQCFGLGFLFVVFNPLNTMRRFKPGDQPVLPETQSEVGDQPGCL